MNKDIEKKINKFLAKMYVEYNIVGKIDKSDVTNHGYDLIVEGSYIKIFVVKKGKETMVSWILN